MSWGSNHPNNQSLYDILGVSKQDSCADIKKAYFKLARTHHPDKGGDPERFKEISKANEILSDEKRRQMYDQFGVTDDQTPVTNHGFQMPQMPGMPPGFSFPFEMNLNDLFGGMFGNPPVGPQRGPQRKGKKPAPTVQTFPITLEQFYMGHKFDININRQSFCTTCDHSGALLKETCRVCHGQGSIKQIVQVGPMEMHTVGPCTDCQGVGQRVVEACNKCSGTGYQADKRNLTVNILPGTKPEELFIFSDVCSDNISYERPGDVHIIIKEDSNDPAFKYFKRSGDALQHLETKISISLAESLIGCVIQMDTHPGYEEGLFIKIPAGSFHGDTYCLTGFGMPIPGHIGSHGDLFIHIDVSVKPMERSLFTTKGKDLLVELFQDKVRKTVCAEDAIQSELYLHKS
jgi:DnaJ family protein A protein 2